MCEYETPSCCLSTADLFLFDFTWLPPTSYPYRSTAVFEKPNVTSVMSMLPLPHHVRVVAENNGSASSSLR